MEFVRKAGNLYCEGVNTWLSLASYKLPSPKVKKEDHHPGGGVMILDVPIGAIEPLTLQFNLKSASPHVLGQFGMSLAQRKLYTIYELLQDEKDGTKRERVITVRGLFSEADPDEMKGRGIQGYSHQIHSITNYEDVIEGHGIIGRFDFFTNNWQGYGVDIGSSADNRILRISG